METYSQIVSNGTYAETLRATRDEIALQIEMGVAARDLASLSKRLLDIQRELKDIEAETGETESPAERAMRARERRRLKAV